MSAPDSELIAVTHQGKQLRFAPCGGTVERKLRANQWYEPELLQYIEALALPGAYVDVGGYVGTHALFFAVHCPSTRVHTFEPRSNCHQLLARNIEVNGLGGKIDLWRFGLSDRDETVTVRLDKRDEVFDCRRMDDIIRDPVSVMKLDVEGMEPRVLAGAARILREHKPLIFAEANSDEELRALTAVLEPYGYRLTGRVFNDSPTYELAVTGGPTGIERLPATRSLMEPSLWASDQAALQVSLDGGTLRLRSTLAAEQSGHATQPPARVRRPPESRPMAVAGGSTWLVDIDAEPPQGVVASVFIMEFAGRERVAAGRHRLRRRMMARVALGSRTDAIRIAFRLTGPGELVVHRVALHGPIATAAVRPPARPRPLTLLARLRGAISRARGDRG